MFFAVPGMLGEQAVRPVQLHRLLDRASKAFVTDYFTILHHQLSTQERHYRDAFHIAAFHRE